jgi:hypothetical protein
MFDFSMENKANHVACKEQIFTIIKSLNRDFCAPTGANFINIYRQKFITTNRYLWIFM